MERSLAAASKRLLPAIGIRAFGAAHPTIR